MKTIYLILFLLFISSIFYLNYINYLNTNELNNIALQIRELTNDQNILNLSPKDQVKRLIEHGAKLEQDNYNLLKTNLEARKSLDELSNIIKDIYNNNN
jgi:hypothetical protein